MKVTFFAKQFSLVLMFACAAKVAANTELKSLENISKELVDIRQDIATLHDEISFEKESFNDQLRSYSNQKADLNVKISRAELNLKDLQRELEKLQADNKEKFAGLDEVTPVLKQAIASLKSSIETSIPFKRDERLQALTDIELRLDSNLVSPNKASNQLWAFVEDELVLGRSSGIYNEVITLQDGNEKLLKVLRIGKVAMYYKTSDEEFGVVRRQGEQWQTSAVIDERSKVQLHTLFDSFAKNIRNGMFEVPNFLPNP